MRAGAEGGGGTTVTGTLALASDADSPPDSTASREWVQVTVLPLMEGWAVMGTLILMVLQGTRGQGARGRCSQAWEPGGQAFRRHPCSRGDWLSIFATVRLRVPSMQLAMMPTA